VSADQARAPATGRNCALVPHLKGVDRRALAQAVARGQHPKMAFGTTTARLTLPKQAAPLIAAINGRRSLTEIAQYTGTDPIGMGELWAKIEQATVPWGLLLYSTLLKG